MSTSVDLREVYPDPLGGAYTSDMDINLRRTAFDRDLGAKIGALRDAARHLGAVVGRRELADPFLRRWVLGLRDARVQALAAVDGLLADLGESDG